MPRRSECQIIIRDLERAVLLQAGAAVVYATRLLQVALRSGVSICTLARFRPMACNAKLFVAALRLGGISTRVFEPLPPGMPDLSSLYQAIVQSRYLYLRIPFPRVPERVWWLIEHCEEGRFKQEVRMSRESFGSTTFSL